MHVLAIEKLRQYYGLGKRTVKVIEPYQMLDEIDNDLQEVIGIDVVGISPCINIFGFPNVKWKEFETFWDKTVLVPERSYIFVLKSASKKVVFCASVSDNVATKRISC